MFERILIPVDGSNTCDYIYKTALEFHEKFNSTIVLVHVDDTSIIHNYVNHPIPELTPKIDGHIRSDEIMKASLAKLNIPESHKIGINQVGDPAGSILDTAQDENIDLILICTHGLGTAKRFLLGSVTNNVVHHADIPVMVIRHKSH